MSKIRYKNITSKQNGFTIVELLVVIVVIGILAAITIVSYTGISKQAIAASLKSDLAGASRVLKIFEVDNGRYPITIRCDIADSVDNKCLKASSTNYFTYNSPDINHTTFNLTANSSDNAIVYGTTNSSAITEAAPVTAIAGISGDIGYPSTVSVGSITPAGATVSYQWKISDAIDGTYVDILGATAAGYATTSGDVGKFLKVKVTGIGTYWSDATSSASSVVARYAPNGNYYLSGDGTLRAGANVTASGATYNTFRTEWDAPNVSYHCGGDPNQEVLSNKTGIRFYMVVCDPLWDYSFLLQGGLVFKPSSNVTIYLAGLVEDCFYDSDDGDVCTYSVPSGVEGSYVSVQ